MIWVQEPLKLCLLKLNREEPCLPKLGNCLEVVPGPLIDDGHYSSSFDHLYAPPPFVWSQSGITFVVDNSLKTVAHRSWVCIPSEAEQDLVDTRVMTLLYSWAMQGKDLRIFQHCFASPNSPFSQSICLIIVGGAGYVRKTICWKLTHLCCVQTVSHCQLPGWLEYHSRKIHLLML